MAIDKMVKLILILGMALVLGVVGCEKKDQGDKPTGQQEADITKPVVKGESKAVGEKGEEPTVEAALAAAGPSEVEKSAAAAADIPRYASNSPFDKAYESPSAREEKQLWAKSLLYDKAPEFVVEKWLTEKPETAGKYVLIEFWATWCGPCRKSIPKLNGFHKKFGDELVVIGISDESEAAVRHLKDPMIEYYSAIDSQKRMKEQVGVRGIPHVILLEPDGYVVWEGYPLLEGYELTEEIIEGILKVGRQQKGV